jgi:hypothetical protein
MTYQDSQHDITIKSIVDHLLKLSKADRAMKRFNQAI